MIQKQKKKFGLSLLLLLMCAPLTYAQTKRITADEYIEMYKHLAVEEMKRTGIPASITMSQGLLESGNGNSRLAKEANNHFGIKCKKDWTGKTINVDDDAPQECFRAYKKAEDSYEDHSNFLTINARYAFLFELDPMDYKGWAKGLKQAGYATNPRYSDLLIDVIERYKLYELDKGNMRRNKDEQKPDEPQPLIAEKAKEKEKFEFNGVPAYVVKDGDTYESITSAHKMMRFEIRKYNDLDKNDVLEPGTIIYLKPKKRKGQQEFHIVKEGESMYYISQLHRIKLKQLYKKNQMTPGMEALAGEKLYLRKKRDIAPALHANPAFAAKKRMLMIDGKEHKPAPASPPVKSTNPPRDLRNTNKPEVIATKPDNLPKNEPSILKEPTVQTEKIKTTAVVSNDSTEEDDEEDDDIETAELEVAPAPVTPVQRKDLLADVDTLLPQRMEATIQRLEQRTQTLSKPLFLEDKLVETKPKTNVSLKNDLKTEVQPQKQATQTVAVQEKVGFHTVQAGETLYSISRKYNTSVDKIKEMNQLGDHAISLGQKLKINGASDAGSGGQQARLPETASYHEVQQGESLFGISRKYGLTVDQLKQLNAMDDNTLSIGQKLKVK